MDDLWRWQARARVTIEDLGPRRKRIHDGDTLRLDIDPGFGRLVPKEQSRLAGINAHELKTGGPGRAARERLIELVPDPGWFRIRSLKKGEGRYGRYLVTLYDHDLRNINWILIQEGHAVEDWYNTPVPEWWGPSW